MGVSKSVSIKNLQDCSKQSKGIIEEIAEVSLEGGNGKRISVWGHYALCSHLQVIASYPPFVTSWINEWICTYWVIRSEVSALLTYASSYLISLISMWDTHTTTHAQNHSCTHIPTCTHRDTYSHTHAPYAHSHTHKSYILSHITYTLTHSLIWSTHMMIIIGNAHF